MPPRLTDERPAWLAVRDRIERKARRPGLAGWLIGVFGATDQSHVDGHTDRMYGNVTAYRNELTSDRMMGYARAVDDVVGELSEADRLVLRRTGQVPDWFLDRVEERRRELGRR